MDEEQYISVPDYAMYGGGTPQLPIQNDRGDLIEKIKPELVVEIIRQKLLGKELINGVWTPIPALQKRRLSEIGAYEIANLMLGTSTINTSISKLDDREIKKRLFSIVSTAQLMLIGNWKEYGITNVSQFRYIHEIVFSNTLVVLKQADEASIQDLLKGTVRGTIGDLPQKETAGRKIGRMLGLSN